MNIKSIGILGGTGGLGARFESYFKEKFSELEIKVSGRNTTLTNQDLVEQCDLIVFAVPIDQTLAVIKAMVPFSRADQIWTDFTSIKQQPIEAMLKSKAQVCGLHPLFGPLPEIEDQTLIYCPARIEASGLKSLLELLDGFKLMKFSASDHDDLMGVVQCASHMSDMVMGETLRKSGLDFETIWQVSSPSYRLKLEVMGRMFAQNPDLYADIATQNLSAHRFTHLFKKATDELEHIVEQRDRAALINSFEATKLYLTKNFCDEAYTASQHFLSSYKAQDQATKAEAPEKVDIAVFGERGSHTDSARIDFETQTGAGSVKFYGSKFKLIEAIDKGEAQWGILPYENTTEGSVLEVLDELLAHPEVQIVGAVDRPIEQYLMTVSPIKLAEIERVYSHPQALSQSKIYLRSHLPKASLEAAASTAQAARHIKQMPTKPLAAIGSKVLAQQMGLHLVTSNMASETNRTRFVLVQKNPKLKPNQVTSMVFWFKADQAGNLATVLNYFSQAHINLLKLDSRRATSDKGDFVFFVDAQISQDQLKNHLKTLKKQVAGIHVLGGY